MTSSSHVTELKRNIFAPALNQNLLNSSLHSFGPSLKTKKARVIANHQRLSLLSINNAMYVKNYSLRQTDATGCMICAAELIVSTTNDICLSSSALFLALYASMTPGKGVPVLVNTCLIR